jgi:hypothetical protein
VSQPVDRGFLARNEASRSRLVRLLDRMTDADLAIVIDGWTAGTNLAHLASGPIPGGPLKEAAAWVASPSRWGMSTINEAP